jgi:hypothetical protein
VEGAIEDGLGALALEVAFEAVELVVVRAAKVCFAALHTPYGSGVRHPAVDALNDLRDAALGDLEVGGEFFLGQALRAVGDVDGLVAVGGGVFLAREGAVVGLGGRGDGHGYLRELQIEKLRIANCKLTNRTQVHV